MKQEISTTQRKPRQENGNEQAGCCFNFFFVVFNGKCGKTTSAAAVETTSHG